MNAFPVIGDLMPARPDAPIIRFQAYRTLIQMGCAEAGLLTLDGKGDEAIDTLLPVLEGSRKLEPSARSLVRFMVARVGQKMCLNTARFILARTPVSADRRARLAGLGERRDLAGFNRRMEEFGRQNSHPPFKNIAGQLMLSWTIPAYTKVLESYWKIEDLRTELAKEVGP